MSGGNRPPGPQATAIERSKSPESPLAISGYMEYKGEMLRHSAGAGTRRDTMARRATQAASESEFIKYIQKEPTEKFLDFREWMDNEFGADVVENMEPTQLIYASVSTYKHFQTSPENRAKIEA